MGAERGGEGGFRGPHAARIPADGRFGGSAGLPAVDSQRLLARGHGDLATGRDVFCLFNLVSW